jgi:predicted nucleic acid-binding protein
VSALYAESSAVLAWLLGESGSSEVVRRINQADTVATSVLTLLEVERALLRAEKQNLLGAGECHKLRGVFARASRAWLLMDVSKEVLEGARRTFPLEPVRTLDAIHLETALLFMQAFSDLTMLTFDRRIEANAQALGIC